MRKAILVVLMCGLVGCRLPNMPSIGPTIMPIGRIGTGAWDDLGAMITYFTPACVLGGQLAGEPRFSLRRAVGNVYEISLDSCRRVDGRPNGALFRVMQIRLDDDETPQSSDMDFYRDLAMTRCEDYFRMLEEGADIRTAPPRIIAIAVIPRGRSERPTTLRFRAEIDALRPVVRFQCLTVEEEPPDRPEAGRPEPGVSTRASGTALAEPSQSAAPESVHRKPDAVAESEVVATHDTITLRKFGISFRIPERWRAKLQSRDAYLCAEAECMALTKIGSVARTRSYTDVVNSIFPWQECLLLMGGDDWRMPRENGIYVRVYVVEAQPKEIERRIYQTWFDSLLKISRAWDVLAEPTLPGGIYPGLGVDEMWSRVLIGNQWLDVDYGDLGQVDFRMRFFGKQTVVFVFMYGDMFPPESYPQLEVIDEILQSVWWTPT